MCCLGALASADTLYNNFAPGDTYNENSGWTINNAQSVANPFDVTGNYVLTSVTIALRTGSDYRVSLCEGGAVAPGSALFSWSALGGGFQVLTPNTIVNLTTGPYYVRVDYLSGISGLWYKGTPDDVGPFSYTNNGSWSSDSFARGVYRVEATPVPEPASLLALGGLVGAAIRRRRKAA